MFWLAAIWLVLAWRSRDAGLFAAHQAALAAATLVATTAWLQQQGWIDRFQPDILVEPRNLQAYGVGLAMLSILWLAVRIAVGRVLGNADSLLHNPLSVDRAVRHAVAAAQWLLLAAFVLPEEVWRELVGRMSPVVPAGVQNAFGPAAWILLGARP